MKQTAVKIIKAYFLLIIVVWIFGPVSIFAQENKEKLQGDKKKIEEEIKYNSQLLEETKKQK